ncbi:twin-arginine translocation signal domain-containing protein [Leifsonia shinshuensis]
MTEKMRPSRRAVLQTAATAAALAALSYLGAEPAVAETTPPQQAQRPAPRRRVPVGLL